MSEEIAHLKQLVDHVISRGEGNTSSSNAGSSSMRHFLIAGILVLSTYASSIEYFPSHYPDDLFPSFPPQIMSFVMDEGDHHIGIRNAYENLTDERDPELLEDLRQYAPWTYLYAVAFDSYIKNQMSQLGPEARQFVENIFSDIRHFEALNFADIIGVPFYYSTEEAIKNGTAEKFEAFSSSSKLELMMHFSPVVICINDHIAQSPGKYRKPSPELVDPFELYVRSMRSYDLSSLKNIVNATSVVKDEAAFIAAAKEHSILYSRIVEMKKRIEDQVQDLEEDARILVRKFYSTCFKQHRLNLYGIEPTENFNAAVKRLAKEFAVLSQKSKADIFVKFPFVAETLLGSLGRE